MTISTLEETLPPSGEASRDRFRQYINPELVSMFARLGMDKTFVDADGMKVKDVDGETYLDFLGGFGSLNLGHNPPEIDAAIDRVSGLANFLQVSVPPVPAALAESLATVTPGDLEKVFFTTSGSEAVEGALKLARISTGRERILSTTGGFHGVTYGALSATSRDKLRDPFSPLLPGFDTVPYGDTDALRDTLLSDDYAAFIVEPIQGENGVIVPPDGYLTIAEEYCRNTGTLLIVDEIQTGFGRTGELWACNHEGVEPDILTMAKSLSGGAIPIGAYIATDEVWQAGYGAPEKALLHASTFTNNTRGCAAGLKALELVLDRDLAQNAAERGQQFRAGVESLVDEYRLLDEVRGKGLLNGVEFYEPLVGKGMSKEYQSLFFGAELLNEHNIITVNTLTNPNVLRFEPPLTVTEAQIDDVIGAIDAVCDAHGSFASLAKSVAGRQVRRRIGL